MRYEKQENKMTKTTEISPTEFERKFERVVNLFTAVEIQFGYTLPSDFCDEFLAAVESAENYAMFKQTPSVKDLFSVEDFENLGYFQFSPNTEGLTGYRVNYDECDTDINKAWRAVHRSLNKTPAAESGK